MFHRMHSADFAFLHLLGSFYN